MVESSVASSPRYCDGGENRRDDLLAACAAVSAIPAAAHFRVTTAGRIASPARQLVASNVASKRKLKIAS